MFTSSSKGVDYGSLYSEERKRGIVRWRIDVEKAFRASAEALAAGGYLFAVSKVDSWARSRRVNYP
jgi:hypothetical protein